MSMENKRTNRTEFYPLAVIGASCYLPDAVSPEEFYSNIFQNQVSIHPIGEDRFPSVFYDLKKGIKGKSYSNKAALVDYDRFCREFVPPMMKELAERRQNPPKLPLPPGHLLALYTAMETFRSAGRDPFHPTDPLIGVFCGLVSANNSDEFKPVFPNIDCFLDILDELPSFASLGMSELHQIRKDFYASGRNLSDFCMRRPEFQNQDGPHRLIRLIQECFGLTGVGFCFDSACSSSVLSLELARNYLATGKISTALVGGMTLFGSSGPIHFSNASSCSADGVFPFDQRANGLISGEGCVFSLVKGLQRALDDGDEILGVVRGIGFSSDGRGKSLWAPSSGGQTLAIQHAFDDSRCESWNEIDCIEAHATSTPLGDSTEMVSLLQAINDKRDANKKFPVTSIKANIGHILEAAGMTSMLKVLLCMKHETMLKQTSFEHACDKFDWASSPFYVLQKNQSWPIIAGHPRKATVQAFGIGGLNAQVLLEGPEGKSDRKMIDILSHQDSVSGKKKQVPVAIIGTGAVLPQAFNVDAFRRLLAEGRSALTGYPTDRKYHLFSKADRKDPESPYNQLRGGFVSGYEYDWRRHQIPPKHILRANPLQFMVLGAVDEAVESAGYCSHFSKKGKENSNLAPRVLDPESTAVVVGTRTDSDFLVALNMVLQLPVFRQRLEKVLIDHSLDQSKAARLADEFNKKIYEEFPCLEDETGGFTISTLASRITKTYDLKGGGIALDSGNISSFAALENGILLLERHPNLKTILTTIGHRSMNRSELLKTDWGKNCPGEGAIAFVLKRLEDAQRDGDPILAVIRGIEGGRLTGSEDQVHQRVENVIQFGKASGRPVLSEIIEDRPNENPTRSEVDEMALKDASGYELVRNCIGNLRPVSGAAALLHLLFQMEDTRDEENPMAILSQIDQDGMFYQMILEKTFSESIPTLSQNPVDVNHSKTATIPEEENSPKTSIDLKTSTKSVTNMTGSNHGRVAFLFSDQGAQYREMMKPFFRAFPDEIKSNIQKLNAVLTRLSCPTFEDLTNQNADLSGKDIVLNQLALLTDGVLVAKTFEQIGIRPDMVLGYGYGEYPAMVTAGILSFETAVWTMVRRSRMIKQAHDGISKSLDPFFDRIDFAFPNIPFLSSVSMNFEADPDLIRKNLVLQMSHPDNFIQMVEKAWRNGARHFVELGPNEILSGKSVNIFRDRPDVHFYQCGNSLKEEEKELDQDALRSLIQIGKERIRSANNETIRISGLTVDLVNEEIENNTETELIQTGANLPVEPSNKCRNHLFRGSDYEMGMARGRIEAERIQRIIQRYTGITGSSKEKLLPSFDPLCIEKGEELFGSDGLDELRGLAEGSGVSFQSLLRHNLSVFPTSQEHVFGWPFRKPYGGCAHYAGSLADEEVVHGGNIDVPFQRIIPDVLFSDLIVRRPNGRIPSVSLVLTGLLGSRGGVNAKGLAVTTSDLLDDAYSMLPAKGFHRGMVLQMLLDHCATLDEAMMFLRNTRFSGAKAIGLSDASGRTALVEYVGEKIKVSEVPSWFGTNHSLLLTPSDGKNRVPTHSLNRFLRFKELLTCNSAGSLTLSANNAFFVLRDTQDNTIIRSSIPNRYRTMNMILRSDNAFSWMFFRKKGILRFQRTLSPMLIQPSSDHFEDYSLIDLLPEYEVPQKPVSTKNANSLIDVSDDKNIEENTKETSFSKGIADITSPKRSGIEDLSEEVFGSLVIDAETATALASSKQVFEQNASGQNRVTVRFEDRLVQLRPLDKNAVFPKTPILLIAGKENPLADTLENLAKERGGHLIRFSVPYEPKTEKIQQEIRDLYEREPFYHLVIATPWDSEADSIESKEDWERHTEAKILTPTMAIQEWFRKILKDKKLLQSRLMAATRMGGDVGVSGRTSNAVGGAWLGIVHSLRFESYVADRAALTAFIVDHPHSESLEKVATDILSELAGPSDRAEDVGYRHENRYAVRMIPVSIPCSVQKSEELPVVDGHRPVWIITGGCRGVTAELAMNIGRQYNARLHLIGSTEAGGDSKWLQLDEAGLKALRQQITREALAQKRKPAEAWAQVEKSLEMRRNLQRFQESGVEIVYHVCDLSNYDHAKQLAEDLIRQEGNIDGILFGAGYEKAALFEKFQENVLRRILNVKVTSAAGILAAFSTTSFPKTIVGMGSISGRLGSSGQIGYCLANNMLGKLLAEFAAKHPGSRSLLVHWHPWGDVGMAVRPESRLVFETSGINFMPAVEGCDRLMDELRNGCPVPEICSTEWNYRDWYYHHPFPVFLEPILSNTVYESRAKKIHTVEQTSDSVSGTLAPLKGLISTEEYRIGNSFRKILGPALDTETDPIDRLGRFVPRLIETDLLEDPGPVASFRDLFQNQAVLLIGENPVADRLEQELSEGKVPVFRLTAADEPCLEEKLNELWRQSSFATVIDLIGMEMPAICNEGDWNERIAPLLMMRCFGLRQIVKMSHESNNFAQMNFMAATSFGGDFGLSGSPSAPTGGLSCGLLKGLRDEIHVKDGLYLPIKTIDHPLKTPTETVVRHLLAELKSERKAVIHGETKQKSLLNLENRAEGLQGEWSPFDVETGYRGKRRFVVRTIGTSQPSDAKSDWFVSLTKTEPQNGVWLLVGGLRGITNVNVFALADQVRPRKIWLVGYSPFEPVDEKYVHMSEKDLAVYRMTMTRESLRLKQSPIKNWNAFHRRLEMTRNHRAFKQLGIDVVYTPCDTRFWQNIDHLVEKIEKAGDHITGFIFGAGWPGRDDAIEKATDEDIKGGLLTKTCGLTAFVERLKNHPLRFAVGFSSVSGRFGGNGQICYTGQNDMVVKTIHAWRGRRPDCRFLCVEWGPWGDVGMAARPDIKGALIAAKILFLTKETGTPLFLNEFYAGLPEPEVLFVSWKYYDRFQPEILSIPRQCADKSKTFFPQQEVPKVSKVGSRSIWFDTYNAETRRISQRLGMSLDESNPHEINEKDLRNISCFLIAAPRDYAVVTARTEYQKEERGKRLQSTLARMKQWRKERIGHPDRNDMVILLTFTEADPRFGVEAREYIEAVEHMVSSMTDPLCVKVVSGPVSEPLTQYLDRVMSTVNNAVKTVH